MGGPAGRSPPGLKVGDRARRLGAPAGAARGAEAPASDGDGGSGGAKSPGLESWQPSAPVRRARRSGAGRRGPRERRRWGVRRGEVPRARWSDCTMNILVVLAVAAVFGLLRFIR